MFAAENGDRLEVPDVLVVLTDGEQSPEMTMAPTLDAAAKALKNRGVTIAVVAAAEPSRLNMPNLKLIASDEKYIFTINSYDEVYRLVYNVSTSLCAGEMLTCYRAYNYYCLMLFEISFYCILDLLQVSLLINKQMEGTRRRFALLPFPSLYFFCFPPVHSSIKSES